MDNNGNMTTMIMIVSSSGNLHDYTQKALQTNDDDNDHTSGSESGLNNSDHSGGNQNEYGK